MVHASNIVQRYHITQAERNLKWIGQSIVHHMTDYEEIEQDDWTTAGLFQLQNHMIATPVNRLITVSCCSESSCLKDKHECKCCIDIVQFQIISTKTKKNAGCTIPVSCVRKSTSTQTIQFLQRKLTSNHVSACAHWLCPMRGGAPRCWSRSVRTAARGHGCRGSPMATCGLRQPEKKKHRGYLALIE